MCGVQHYLTGEPVPGIVYEARLAKTLLPRITAEDMQAVADAYRTHNSCVIKTVSEQAGQAAPRIPLWLIFGREVTRR